MMSYSDVIIIKLSLYNDIDPVATDKGPTLLSFLNWVKKKQKINARHKHFDTAEIALTPVLRNMTSPPHTIDCGS